MQILITGAAGFLGLHLAKYLTEKKYTLILVDIAPFAKEEYPKGCQFHFGDVRNQKMMDMLAKKSDVVIHAAAALPLWKAEEIMDININGTKNMLDAAFKNKVKRFIHISSTAVYGVPKVHPIHENAALIGVGHYGQSKIQAERLCNQYQKKGLTVTIVRPKTFVGTYRLGVFEILFDWIKDGKRIPIIGSGNNRYQLLDVDDLTEAVYRFIKSDKKNANGTFNIGAEEFATVKRDLESLFKYAGNKSKVFSTPAFLVKKLLWLFEKLKISPLYQWVYETADKDSFVSIERLKKTLRWKPRYSNSQALIKSYQWYLENYKEIKSRPVGINHTSGWKQGILGFFKRFM